MSVETFEPKLRSDPNAHSHPRTRGCPFTKGNDGSKNRTTVVAEALLKAKKLRSYAKRSNWRKPVVVQC